MPSPGLLTCWGSKWHQVVTQARPESGRSPCRCPEMPLPGGVPTALVTARLLLGDVWLATSPHHGTPAPRMDSGSWSIQSKDQQSKMGVWKRHSEQWERQMELPGAQALSPESHLGPLHTERPPSAPDNLWWGSVGPRTGSWQAALQCSGHSVPFPAGDSRLQPPNGHTFRPLLMPPHTMKPTPHSSLKWGWNGEGGSHLEPTKVSWLRIYAGL
ncbi:hypothetical protein H1C71_008024 [Ictidomys tridecemlineatus]|nr:hypothetical protein H1C71_008024 [Ictidomys tridecemlineatus]